MKTYFKVLTTHRSSVAVWDNRITYPLNEWISPPIPDSYLFIFDSEEAAVMSALPGVIYRCHAQTVIKPPIANRGYLRSPEIDEYWKEYNECRKKHKKVVITPYLLSSEKMPWGTLWARKVKLLGLV